MTLIFKVILLLTGTLSWKLHTGRSDIRQHVTSRSHDLPMPPCSRASVYDVHDARALTSGRGPLVRAMSTRRMYYLDHRKRVPKHLCFRIDRSKPKEGFWKMFRWVKAHYGATALRDVSFEVRIRGENAVNGGLTPGPTNRKGSGYFKDSPNSHEKWIVPNAFPEPALIPGQFKGYNEEAWYYGLFLATVFLNDEITIDTFFKPSLYKILAGKSLELDDLKEDDEELYNNLRYISRHDFDSHDLDLSFTVTYENEHGEMRVDALKPCGDLVHVTNENKEEYVRLLAHWHLFGHAKEFYVGFVRGFYCMLRKGDMAEYVDDPLLLREKIGGLQTIRVDALRQQSSAPEDHPMFWKVFSTAAEDMKKCIFRFITALPSVPLHGVRMVILTDLTMRSNQLPRARTCFNQLFLPPYENEDMLREKLYFAVTHGADTMDGEEEDEDSI